MLALPDRYRLLQGVDAEPGSFEGFGPVRRRRYDGDRSFGQRKVAGAVEQRETLHHWPASPRLGGDLCKPRHCLFFVSLVRDAAHVVAALGVVAHDAEEHDDRARRLCGGPCGGSFDRQGNGCHGDPIAGCGRKHRVIVVNLTHSPSGAKASDLGLFGSLSTETGDGKREKAVGTLRAVSGSEGDDAAREGDDSTGGPRPDPLDRPWVHPSELRSYVANPLPASQARPREWVIGLVSATVGVAATLLVLIAFGVLGERTRSPLPPPVITGANTAVDYAVAGRVSQFVAPSVVTVRATTSDGINVASGVAVSSNRVLASAHVVVGATAMSVSTLDGHTYPSKIMGSDADTDLVLLDVPGADLSFQPLAGAAAKVGQPVVAVATTKGNHAYLALDIISRLNLLVTTSTGSMLAGLLGAELNTTAETSGGGLFNTNGQLVGILTSPPGVGISGLAVPIGVADDVRDQIESSGKVTHGWLGLTADDTSDRAGATVTAVLPDSPAAAAKLDVGDVITRAGGQFVGNVADLMAEWRRGRPGDSIEITYRRGHSSRDLRVQATLTGPPPPPAAPAAEPSSSDG